MTKITVVEEGEVDFAGEFSILDTLDEAGIDVSSSCREGSCGSCEAILLSGDIEYIQEPSYELSDSCILTCCAIPITDVTIELM